MDGRTYVRVAAFAGMLLWPLITRAQGTGPAPAEGSNAPPAGAALAVPPPVTMPPAAPVAEPAPREAVEMPVEKPAKKKKKKLSFSGRVIARSAFAQIDPSSEWTGQSSVDSARVGVDYQSRELRVRVSAELAGKPRLKNAYAELRLVDGHSHKLSVRAGQFKMPISAIERESRWTLPMTDRGLVHAILTGRYQIAGRVPGVMVTATSRCALHARAELGVFQGRDDTGDALDARPADRFGQDVVGRVEIQPARGMKIAAAAQARVGALAVDAPPIIRRGKAAGLDLTLERKAGPGIARLWLESMVGTTWLLGRTMPCNGARSCKELFLEGRAIAAYRFGGREPKDRYTELYAAGGVLDPDHSTSVDLTVEVGGGLTYGAWERWRVQGSVDVWRFGDSAPLGLAEFGAAPTNSVRVLLQLGARL